MPHTAEEAAAAIDRLATNGGAPGGTLRVFGDWFGKPYDNWHVPVSALAAADCLTVRFDGGETLTVWEPGDVTATPDEFRIRAASRVRWEWFHYGREQIPENLCVEEHWTDGDRVRASSTAEGRERWFAPSVSFPAAELLRY